MRINSQLVEQEEIRVDELSTGEEFIDKDGDVYMIPEMLDYYFDHSMRDRVGDTDNQRWVFNVGSGCLAVYEKDAMVRPVSLIVHVEKRN